ncbi:MAG: LacI family DNA-binding transcriptional regulator, partial [Bacilli bacterium]
RLSKISSSLIPFVVIGNPKGLFGGKEGNSIDTDNVGLVRRIFLEMKRQGCKKITMINSNQTLTITQDRDEGFNEAANSDKIAKGEIFYSAHSTKEDGYYYASRALKDGADAIICANGFIASGAYEAIGDAGLKVGTDVKVFSLGYSHSNDLSFAPSLSYAAQDYAEFARQAVDLIVDDIANKSAPKSVIISSKIHYNDSFVEPK